MKFSLITRAGRSAFGVLLSIFLCIPASFSVAAAERLATDGRGNAAAGAVTNDAAMDLKNLRVDPVTGELLIKGAAAVGGATAAKQDTMIGHLVTIIAQLIAGQTSTEPVVIAVGTTPTLILSASAVRRGATVQNMGTAIVFLGKAAVTTATGIAIRGGVAANDAKGQTATTDDGDALFGIVVSGSVNVRVREVSD